MKKYLRPSLVACFLCCFVAFYAIFNISHWKNHKTIYWDVIGYYAYLPATFVHNDIELNFLKSDSAIIAYNDRFWPEKTPEGHLLIKGTMGMAIMYAPLFFAAHAMAHITGAGTDGFSMPYHMFISMSGAMYMLFGLFFLAKTLRLYFNEWITAISILVVFFGTNLYYYTVYEGAMTHANLFALFAVFMYFSIKWHIEKKWYQVAIAGLAGGLATLIRPSDILIFLVFALYGITSWKDLINRPKLFLQHYKHVLILVICAAIAVFPQLVYWKIVTGNWLYYSYGEESFFLKSPVLFEGLFGFRKGWITYTPVMGLALLGLFFMGKYNSKNLQLPLVLFVIINIWILLSWWCWWYGGSFGNRAFVQSYALMAIPLAALIQEISKLKRLIPVLATILVFFTYLNLFQTWQYSRKMIHFDSMTFDAYKYVFLKSEITGHYWSLLEKPDYEKALKGEWRK